MYGNPLVIFCQKCYYNTGEINLYNPGMHYNSVSLPGTIICYYLWLCKKDKNDCVLPVKHLISFSQASCGTTIDNNYNINGGYYEKEKDIDSQP